MKILKPVNWEKDVLPHWSVLRGATVKQQPLWEKLPSGMQWHAARFESGDDEKLYVIGSGDWEKTYGSYRVIDIARQSQEGDDAHNHRARIRGFIETLNSGGQIAEVVAVAAKEQGPYVLIDGNHRAIALVAKNQLRGQNIFLGIHRDIDQHFQWFYPARSYREMNTPDAMLKDQTIFVSVASYRDTETAPTLEDMFAKARYPHRITAGVFWQADPRLDSDCMQVPQSVPHTQVRGLQVHPKDSLGACWARSRILTELREDEQFVLQIDSHMRFAQDWDVRLLDIWNSCPSPRALLSTYPVGYVPPDKLDPPRITIMRPKLFNERGLLRPLAVNLAFEERPERPIANPLISAGFLFGPAQCFDEVPYDPKLYFFGEEISYAVRLWTHGWDVFTPNDVLIYHFYGRTDNRPKHWSDNPLWTGLNEVSQTRVRHLLGMEVSQDPKVLDGLDQFGLGKRRTVAEYEEFAGVNFARRKISPGAWSARFPSSPHQSSLQLRRTFDEVFQKNKWVAWETRSGFPSTLPATRELRLQLEALFARDNVRSLVDAGCGDVYWMERLTQGLDLYLGMDVSPQITHQNIRMLGHRRGHFFNAGDICRVPIPPVDAVLCRNVINVLALADALRAVINLVDSKARLLLMTTYLDTVNADGEVGVHRHLDLCAQPFCLPAPREYLTDYRGRKLGVWETAGLADWRRSADETLKLIDAAPQEDAARPLQKMPVTPLVISMRPEFWERLRNKLVGMHTAPELWSATDGRAIDVAQWEASGRIGEKAKQWQPPMTRGEFGCYDSHFRAWQHVLDQKLGGALILEDDANPGEVLVDRIRQAWEFRADWDVIYLGYTWRARTEPISGVTDFVRPDMKGGWHVTHAYLLTAAGAAKLVQRALPIETPVDVFLARRAVDDLRVWQCKKSIVPTFEDTFSSTQRVR